MDMSFAGQALSVEYVARHHADAERGVHVVPADIDAEIARLKLEARGIFLDGMTEEQLRYTSSWQHGTCRARVSGQGAAVGRRCWSSAAAPRRLACERGVRLRHRRDGRR